MKHNQSGVTLLEIILVLTIGASILYLSIMQYLSYRRDADIFQLQTNVNAIFSAMNAYYKQQCFGTAPDQVVSPGKLNPKSASPLPDLVPIDIKTDLVDTGFLTTTIPLNPIVKSTGAGTKGYVAQFNRNPMTNRQVCMKADAIGQPGTFQGTNDPACTDKTGTVGQIVTWRAQVAVQLNNAATAKQYLSLLAGDCLSTTSGSGVEPCSTSGNTGTFVVWERIPSNANPQATSNEWVSRPTVNLFTQMYTTYPILGLTNGSQTADQYYLCGN